MTKRQNSVELDKSTSQAYSENKDELHKLLDLLKWLIDEDKMPKAKELLKTSDKNGKILRPPNSNLIYTNLLGKLGLLDIIKEYCEKYKFNKQDLVPISKKLSKILWK